MKKHNKVFFLGAFLILVVSESYATKLDTIIQKYKQAKYEASSTMAKSYVKKHPTDFDANLILASSYFKLKKYHDALVIYDRLLIMKPDDIDIRIEIAKIYYLTNNPALLNLSLNSLLSENLSVNQKKEIRYLISQGKTSSKKDKKHIKGSFNIGILYDTNVDNDIGEKAFYYPAFSINLKGDKKEKKFAHFESFYIQANKELSDKINIDGKFGAYNKDYFSSSKHDLRILNLEFSPNYEINDYKFSMPFVYDKHYLNSKSFLSSLGLGVDVQKYLDDSLMQISYRYRDNNYSNDRGRDSVSHNVLLGGKKLLGRDKSYLLSLYLKYNNNKEKNNLRSDISYEDYGLDVKFSKDIARNLIGFFSSAYSFQKFKDTDLGFLNKRKDKLLNIGMGAIYNINTNSIINFDMNYIKRDSNQVIYDYDRYISRLYYTYRY